MEIRGLPKGSLFTDYKRYIMRLIGIDSSYSKLVDLMLRFKFYYTIPKDDNRVGDALYNVRANYLWKQGIDIYNELNNQDCSVLEMLVAFAIRIDKDFLQEQNRKPGNIIFWKMLKNLGLDRFDNEIFDGNMIIDILTRWLDRRFKPNGVGSPFPIRHPNRDMRNVELWEMMTNYISENY